ncbi:LON peptidase substrate-binding domain-containing protein [Rhodobaculum claviforme]|uniref:ATP-dependent protease n=1 Tax=Rhodobaculum claviforme TaxID=1549854 RepID=A0A934WJ86_9RHOB|nr:LON peptidase substrate-binding domain-containing protein [Rhodobaculum claviforme]MBK5927268.1 ATP-dependent protease [Rhodobaculum claviforme]
MIKPADLPNAIPIFPLPGALLLPRARLPLHIFEPRYLAMVEACLATPHRLIGMIQPGAAPGTRESRLHSIGCAGRLTGFSETEDGRYLITLSGISRFRLVRETTEGTPFRTVEPSWEGFERDLGQTEADTQFSRDRFFDLLGRFFSHHSLSTDWEALKDAEDELLINSLSMLCPFEPEDKQALLEAPSLSTRRETLVTLIEFALRGGTGEETLQ